MKFTSRTLSLLIMAASLLTASCGSPNNANHGASNTAGAENKNATPAGAKPLGIAGYYSIGPTGPVALHCTSPKYDEVIEAGALAPTFEISGYPIYRDEERRKGQHIEILIDNDIAEADYDPAVPFHSPRFKDLKPGTHLLRAFPAREWNESIKQPDGAAFDAVVFHIRSKSPGAKAEKTTPLLTLSEPPAEVRWKDDPRGVLVDFYVSNAALSPNDYKVKFSLGDKKTEILSRWDPVWLKWEQLVPGDYKIGVELLDKNDKPVSYKIGGVDYNKVERIFRILAEREKSRISESR